MDFEFSREEVQLREDLVSLLDGLIPDWWYGQRHHYNRSQRAFELTLQVCEAMAERGWLTAHWPEEYGGREASIFQQVVMREELWVRGEPRGPQYMSVNWVGPAIMRFGSEAQKRLHLRAISAGKSLWCQGFSEPQAGSDLAAVRCSARRDDDEYVINGEKIWTSHTPHAEWCFLVVRTHPDAPKHRGISVLLVPMDTPGLTVRPIESLTGAGSLASLTFENARVPASALLGEENDGWRTVLTALAFERVGAPRYVVARHQLDELVRYCARTRRNGVLLAEQDWVRRELARLRVEIEVARLLYYRAASLVARDEEPGLAGSLQRIAGTTVQQKVADVAFEILGTEAQRTGPGFVEGLGEEWLESLPATIAAGTLEVQKNVAATRGLGLPRG